MNNIKYKTENLYFIINVIVMFYIYFEIYTKSA
jgi:hypothetical protein